MTIEELPETILPLSVPPLLPEQLPQEDESSDMKRRMLKRQKLNPLLHLSVSSTNHSYGFVRPNLRCTARLIGFRAR